VISLGYNAWGQREELAALKEYGQATQPAWVVTLFLVFNDVRNNSPDLQMQGRDQQVRILQFRPDWVRLSADSAPFLFFRWSALNRLISHRLALLLSTDRNDKIPLDYFVYKKPLDAEWEDAWEHTELLLDETQMQADRLGARYAIVSASTPHGVMGPEKGVRHLGAVYPKMRDVQWDLDQPDERLAEYCRRRDIPFLRLEPIFRHETLSEGRTLHWRYDGHWNVEGNDLAGERIAHFLADLDACAHFEQDVKKGASFE
jgi:hypothetical protein